MATARTCLTMAVLMVAGMLLSSGNLVWAQCGGSVQDATMQCAKFVQKTGPDLQPSALCCTVLRSFDIPCICNKHISKGVEDVIDVRKAGIVARACGLDVPPGFQCGPVTVPPP